jgi:hypothetical protein
MRGVTTLTYNDLVDFISTTCYKTHSYFKMNTEQTEKDPQKLFLVCLWNGSFDQSNVSDRQIRSINSKLKLYHYFNEEGSLMTNTNHFSKDGYGYYYCKGNH